MSDLIYHKPQQQYRIDACLPQLTAARQGKIDLNALTHGNYPGHVLPVDAIPEISSMGVLDARGNQDWGMEDHRNEGIEVCFQESGKNTLVTGGKKYPLHARTLSITRPWELHRLGDPYLGSGRLHWIIIDVGVRRPNQTWRWPPWCVLTAEDLEELSQLIRTTEQTVWKVDSEFVDVFRELAGYVIEPNPERRTSRITVAINRLLIAMLEVLRSHRGTSGGRVSAFGQTVELFLQELQRNPDMLAAPWTLQSMASHCGMGRSAFSKYCYESQNLSPVDYLNRCRIHFAASRLKSESASVTTIAMDLGFSSSQYFSRAFKRHLGMTPSQWRSHGDG